SLRFMGDHRVDGTAVLPATAYLEIGLALAADLGIGRAALRDVRFHRVKELGEASLPLRTVGVPTADGEMLFQVRGAAEAGGLLYASGTIGRPRRETGLGRGASLEEIRARCLDEIGGDELYAELAKRGLGYR